MNIKKLGFAAIGVFTIAVVVSLAKEIRGTYMSVSNAKARWGITSFDANKWKAGSSKVRASMVASLVEGRQFIGKPISSIRGLLGNYSGHLWSDEIPTYIVEEGWDTGKDTWQVVFLPDRARLVREVKIHKNCCD